MKKVTIEELKERQGLPLNTKIKMTQNRIEEWYIKNNGNIYVSFSGGIDSTVLIDIVRKMYPDIRGLFIDTGLEYPEIKQFVNLFPNIDIVRPEMPFHKIIKEHGYPVISKMQAQYIDQYRNSTEKMKDLRWNGRDYGYGPKYKISEKWKYLINAPFKISDKCCEYMKKRPFKKYNKETGLKAMVGIMAIDSDQRQKQYLQDGCNSFNLGVSKPIAFWTSKDIWEYVKKTKLNYCSVYDSYNGEIRSTGCMFCMFGVHLEKGENRFEKMKRTHPKHYKYCIEKLGLNTVLDYIKVRY